MSMSNTFENDWLLLVFNNTNISLIGDATGLRGSTTAGSLYVSWHTADPGEAGSQTTSEAAYTGYGRIAVARSAGGWTVSTNSVSNTAAVTGNQNTGTTETERFWAIGTDSTGTGKVLFRGHLGTAPIAFTATTADTVTAPGHTFVDTNEVVTYARPGATIPAGITEGTVYFVRDTSGDTFKLAATSGGTAIDLTAAGAGVIGKVTKLDIANLVFPEFAIGQLSVTVD
jgi:hypothetical protein